MPHRPISVQRLAFTLLRLNYRKGFGLFSMAQRVRAVLGPARPIWGVLAAGARPARLADQAGPVLVVVVAAAVPQAVRVAATAVGVGALDQRRLHKRRVLQVATAISALSLWRAQYDGRLPG